MGKKKSIKDPPFKSDPPKPLKWLPLGIVAIGIMFSLFLILNANNTKRSSVSSFIPPALGGVKTPIPERHNFFNGDFQSNNIEPWFYLDNIQWGGFKVETETLKENTLNRFARVDASTASPPVLPVKVFGAVQEWSIEQQIPAHLNFKMRVHNEQKLCSKQYAQAVIIFSKEGVPKNIRNLQLRIITHGLNTAPYNLSNAVYFMNPDFKEDDLGWRNYSLPLQEWFKKSYPHVAENHWKEGKIRLLLEARYDNLPKTTPVGTSILTVDFDDISLSKSQI